jgi:hypothetical protein
MVMRGWKLCALLMMLGGPAAFAQGSQVPTAGVTPAHDGAPRREIPALHPFYRAGVATRGNPTGLFTNLALLLRYRLYTSDSLALRDNYVGAGAIGMVSPAFMRGGLGVEFQPLSILQLSASYEGISYFGTFNFLQSYDTPNAVSSDRRLEELDRAGRTYATTGTLLTLAGLLQLKVGPVAVRSNLRAFQFNLRLREGDTVFYDPVLDVVTPNGGWSLSNDADLLYVAGKLAVGLRHTVTHASYGPEHYPAGDQDLGLNPTINRLGPFLSYTFHDREDRLFNAPTLVLITQWFVSHRYRTGQEVHQGIPWVALAFQFKGIPGLP